jgi:hypothetical protein
MLGFVELSRWKSRDIQVAVKRGCLYEEFCPSRDGCVLDGNNMVTKKMTANEFFNLYAAGERDFFEVEITNADW